MAGSTSSHECQWSKNLQYVPSLSQAEIDKWANEDANAKIPRAKQQKGYSNWIEGYIHGVEVKEEVDGCSIRAFSYPSMRKNDHPYRVQARLQKGPPLKVSATQCACKAGNGSCSHMIGLLYTTSHYLKMGFKCVPLVESKTSLPQTWHIPSRRHGLSAKPVDSLAINKVKPRSSGKPVKRRIIEGVLPNLYCPVTGKKPECYREFSSRLSENLSAIKSDAQILSLLPKYTHAEEATADSPTKFGMFPHGSCISQQHKLSPIKSRDIINVDSSPPYPPFPLPQQPSCYSSTLDKAQFDIYAGLQVDEEMARDTEVQTREQNNCKLWHSVRSNRLTSSIFKQVCCRQNDFEVLATRLIRSKPIQTQAMKHGIEYEPFAAEHYSMLTGNNVYTCGFVVNPSAPHLGTSPDRRVFDAKSNNQFGLLEIKCPVTNSYTDCKYLKIVDGKYKLKKTHDYYYQVMGQMGITGMQWCDLFIETKADYHMERIQFFEKKWCEMKEKLDVFFFMYYLPLLAQ